MLNLPIAIGVTSFQLLISILAFFLLPLIYFWYQTKYQYWKKRGLNGPPVYPILGNSFNLFTPLPLLQIQQVKKYGKFFGLFQGKRPVICVADPAVIKTILVKEFPTFRNRMGFSNRNPIAAKNLVAVRDETWKRIRSILSPMFTTSKLKKMEPMINQCVDSMVDAMEDHTKISKSEPTIHAHNFMGNFTMDVIAKCAFATDTNAHKESNNKFVQSARQVFHFTLPSALITLIVPSFISRLLSKLKVPYFYVEGNTFFEDISRHLIKKRKNDPSLHVDDMLQLMIKAEHGKDGKSFEKEDEVDAHHVNLGKEELEQEEKLMKEIIGSKYLSEDEIIAQSMIFFLAGYETTASTLTFCLYQLATHKDIQDRLYKEVKTIVDSGEKLDYKNVMTLNYLDAVISETLRICPPAIALNREASEDCYIEEYNFTIKKGEVVMIPVYEIHHNPEFFKNPEEFDPERFLPENRDKLVPYSYLPFGGGPRNCIGMRFALSEAKLGLAKMLMQFEFYPSAKTPKKLNIEKSLFILKTTPIYVGVRRRN